MSDEIREYERRVEAARSELEILQATNKQLMSKLMSANTLNDDLQGRLEQARRDAGAAKADHDRAVAELQDVERQAAKLAQDVEAMRPRADKSAARLGDARAALESDEDALRKRLAAAEAAAERREAELNAQIKQQRETLAATRAEADDLASISVTHQTLKAEAAKLKQQLIQAKAYSLHKSLAATIQDSRDQTDRLRKIIEHVRQEKHKVDSELRERIAERDQVKRELSQLVLGTPSPTAAVAASPAASLPMSMSVAMAMSPAGGAAPRPAPGAPGSLIAAARAAAAKSGAGGAGPGPAASAPGAATRPSAPPASSAPASMTTLRDLVAASGPGGHEALNAKLNQSQAQRLDQMSREFGADGGEASAWREEVQAELRRMRQEAMRHTEAVPGETSRMNGHGR